MGLTCCVGYALHRKSWDGQVVPGRLNVLFINGFTAHRREHQKHVQIHSTLTSEGATHLLFQFLLPPAPSRETGETLFARWQVDEAHSESRMLARPASKAESYQWKETLRFLFALAVSKLSSTH